MEEYKSDLLRGGYFAEKQIFCADPIISCSHRSRFATARKLLSRYAGKKLLDYGCGDGTFLAIVSDLFPQATGADRCLDAVNRCRDRLQGQSSLSFVMTQELGDPELTQSFDIVTCMEVLEHCIAIDREEVLHDLKRLVSNTGKVLISVPVEIGPSLLLKYFFRWQAAQRHLGDYAYYERHRVDELLLLLFADENTKFERPMFFPKSGEQGHPSHGHKGFNWKALRTILSGQFEIEKIHFSPIHFLGEFCNSQVWFLLSKHQTG